MAFCPPGIKPPTRMRRGERTSQASFLYGNAVREMRPDSPHLESAVRADVERQHVARVQVAGEDGLRQQRFGLALEIALKRPRAVDGVIAVVGDQLARRGRDLQRKRLLGQPCAQVRDEQIDDGGDVLARKRLIEDDFVKPVEELGAEGRAQQLGDGAARLLADFTVAADAVQQVLRPEVGRRALEAGC